MTKETPTIDERELKERVANILHVLLWNYAKKTDEEREKSRDEALVTLATLATSIREEERESCLNKVVEVIVKNYDDAARRYNNVKDKKEGWAKADAISENSKQVAYSRLEPEIRKALTNPNQ